MGLLTTGLRLGLVLVRGLKGIFLKEGGLSGEDARGGDGECKSGAARSSRLTGYELRNETLETSRLSMGTRGLELGLSDPGRPVFRGRLGVKPVDLDLGGDRTMISSGASSSRM